MISLTKIKGVVMGNKPKKNLKWEGENLELLKALYPFMADKELAKLFGRGLKTIATIRRLHGLERVKMKCEEYKRLIRRVPIIIIKDRDKFDEDLLKLNEMV